ncbi:hypothetical protein HK104_004665 [Borealophlyctis nickersoniae]|nr:hypothetical protein HK104_004665 [Borealophlyctis nickersoniae]
MADKITSGHSQPEAVLAEVQHEEDLRTKARALKRPRRPASYSGQSEDSNAYAARASRLSPNHMSDPEKAAFPDYIFPLTARKSYLRARNYVLAQWLRNPKVRLELDALVDAAKSDLIPGVRDEDLVIDAFRFLDRYRYINFGILPIVRPAKDGSTHLRRPRIIVVGAGMAGVTAARELLNLYGNHPESLEPIVTILEGRKRVGGRIFTFPLHTRAPGKDEAPGVDLAAQIITGFEGGNPLDCVVKSQLGLPLHFLYDANKCKLYDVDGKEADSTADELAGEFFNEILEQSCYTIMEDGVPIVQNGPRIRQEPEDPEQGGKNPSLGEIFDHHLQRHEKFERLRPLDMRLVHWHMANLEFANGAIVDRLSLQHWDQDDDFEFDGHHAMIPGGYGQVPHAYAFGGGAALDIRFDKAVEKIVVEKAHDDVTNSMDGMIKIICRDRSEFVCDAVVVTVPLGVLKVGIKCISVGAEPFFISYFRLESFNIIHPDIAILENSSDRPVGNGTVQ